MTCQIESAHPITVGEKITIICSEKILLDPQSTTLSLDEADKYKLNLLELKENQLIVTSYRPGQHDLKSVTIKDTEKSLVLGDFQLEVQSVISPSAVVEPYGPWGLIVMAVPLFYWLILAVVFLLLSSPFVGKYWLYRQRQRGLAAMRINEATLLPDQQFYQTVRRLRKQIEQGQSLNHIINELNQSFRFYIARKYFIPTQIWSDKKIIKDFRRRHDSSDRQKSDSLIKILAEFRHAAQSSSLKSNEVVQLVSQCQKWVEETSR